MYVCGGKKKWMRRRKSFSSSWCFYFRCSLSLIRSILHFHSTRFVRTCPPSSSVDFLLVFFRFWTWFCFAVCVCVITRNLKTVTSFPLTLLGSPDVPPSELLCCDTSFQQTHQRSHSVKLSNFPTNNFFKLRFLPLFRMTKKFENRSCTWSAMLKTCQELKIWKKKRRSNVERKKHEDEYAAAWKLYFC